MAPPAAPPDRPTPLTRALFFVGGAIVGGVIGYGFVSSGPPPTPSISDPQAAIWVFGSAAVVGTIAAIATWRVFRPSRRLMSERDDR